MADMTEVERLIATLEAAVSGRDTASYPKTINDAFISVKKAREELLSAIRKLEEDAARYRWLREQSHPWGQGRWYSRDALDAAIDTSRGEKE